MALHAACSILLFLMWTINQSIAWALPTLLSWSRWPVIHYLPLKAGSHIPTRLSLALPTRQLYPNYLGMSHTTTRLSDRYRTRRLYQYLPIEILTVGLLILNISRFTTRQISRTNAPDLCYNHCCHIPTDYDSTKLLSPVGICDQAFTVLDLPIST